MHPLSSFVTLSLHTSTMFRSRLQAFRPVIAYRTPRLALRPPPFVNSTSTTVYGAMRPMSATAGSGPNVEEAISNIEELFGAAKDEVNIAPMTQASDEC